MTETATEASHLEAIPTDPGDYLIRDPEHAADATPWGIRAVATVMAAYANSLGQPPRKDAPAPERASWLGKRRALRDMLHHLRRTDVPLWQLLMDVDVPGEGETRAYYAMRLKTAQDYPLPHGEDMRDAYNRVLRELGAWIVASYYAE